MEMPTEEALDYTRQVMQRFDKETETLKEFHWLLSLFRGKFIDSGTLSSKVKTLFEGHDDLIQGFRRFVHENHDCTRSPTPPQSPLSDEGVEARGASRNLKRKAGKKGSSGKPRSPVDAEREDQFGRESRLEQDKKNKKEKSIEFLNTIREKLENDQKYREFLEVLCKYEDHRDTDRLDSEVLNMFRQNPEFHIEFSGLIADAVEAKSHNAEDTGLDMNRIDPHGNRMRTFRSNNVNHYQKVLFACEDEMFVTNMTFHHLERTREAMTRYLENQKKEVSGSKKNAAEEFFMGSDARLIKYLYSGSDEHVDGGHDEVMERQLWEEQPIAAAEIVLKRLDQKLEELEAWRQGKKESWAETLKMYTKKALYFEPVEKKRCQEREKVLGGNV